MSGFRTIIALLLLAPGPGCSFPGGEKALMEQKGGKAEAAVVEIGSVVQGAAKLTAEGMPRFSGYDLPAADMPYEKGQWVWAAVPMDYGFKRWTIVQALFVEAVEGHALVSALSASLTPSAFLRPLEPAADAKPGEPVLVHKGLEAAFGRVVEVTEEGIEVTFCAGKGVGVGLFPPGRVMSLVGESYALGAPVVFRTGEGRAIGRFVFETGAKAYVVSPAGALLELPRDEIELINMTKHYAAGAQVLVQKPGALLSPAVLTKVMPGGAAYRAKTEDGESLTVSYGCIGPAGL